MTVRDYILKEKRIMERQCRQKGISPDEWVSKYAHVYHKKYADKVLAVCFAEYK